MKTGGNPAPDEDFLRNPTRLYSKQTQQTVHITNDSNGCTGRPRQEKQCQPAEYEDLRKTLGPKRFVCNREQTLLV